MRAGGAALLLSLTFGLPPTAAVPRTATRAQGVTVVAPAPVAFRRATADLAAGIVAAAPGNAVVSPAALGASLALLSIGASGTTRAELVSVAGLDRNDPAQWAIGLSLNVLGRRIGDTPGTTPRDAAIGVAVWVRTGISVRPDYIDAAVSGFGSEVERVDAADPAATAVVDRWAAERTSGKVTKAGVTVGPADSVMLSSVAGATLPWARHAEGVTRPGTFMRADGSTVTVPMMMFELNPGTIERVNGVDMVRLPFWNGYEMIVALTADPRPLVNLERQLVGQNTLTVFVPRFRNATDLDLRAALAAKLPITFGRAADFRSLTTERSTLTQARQRATLAIDENGTEVPQAPSVTIRKRMYPPKRELYLDRPFTYMIRHTATGLMVFLGRVADPTTA